MASAASNEFCLPALMFWTEFGDAQKQAAHDGSGDAAEAAHDGSGKGLERDRAAHLRVHEINGSQQCAAQAGEQERAGEGDCDHPADVDAHESRDLTVLGHGAEADTHHGPLKEEVQTDQGNRGEANDAGLVVGDVKAGAVDGPRSKR